MSYSEMHGSIHSPDAINFFKGIHASDRLINLLQEGYKIPFSSLPDPFWHRNNASAIENMDFVREKVDSWLQDGFVMKCDTRPQYVSPLSVDCKKPKKRLCLDCRVLNNHIIKENTKLPTLKISESLIDPHDYGKTLDLSNAYFHVNINENDQDKLGFAVPKIDNEDEYDFYTFKVMIYGLTSATFVLNMITKPLIDFASSLNIKVVLYIDDFRITCIFKYRVENEARTIKQIFNNAGFIFNDEKESESSQQIEYLGFIYDTTSLAYSVPSKKLEKIKILVDTLTVAEQYTPKYIASIVGKLISCEIACGILPKLHLFPYFKWIRNTITSDAVWKSPRNISKQLIKSITKSFETVRKYSGKLRPKDYHYKYIDKSKVHIKKVQFVGDGNEYFGAYYKLDEENKYKIIQFSGSDQMLSSSYRELLVLHQCVKQNRVEYANQNICYMTDSRVLHFWAEHGSCSQKIADKLIDIFTWTHDNNIILDVVWCPRTNESLMLADNSCKSDTDEFTLPDNVYEKILKTLNVNISLDLFASSTIHRSEMFYTKKPSLGSLGANALRFNWGGDTVKFCFPPKNLLFKVFKKIEATEELNLVLVFLKTKGDIIFKLFIQGNNFKDYIKKCLVFDSKVYSPFFQSKFTVSTHTWYVMHITKDRVYNLSLKDIIEI